MITSLSKIFGTKTKAQEIILLQQNVKKVVRQGYYDEELKKVEEFCNENNLFLVKSKFKVKLENSHYTNKGIRVKENEEGMYFTYISRDEEKAWLACYYEQINDHENLGKILGYPKCCRDYFLKNFNENNTNLELNSKGYLNLSQREQDAVLISHFPCNKDCQESIKIAKGNLKIIQQIDQQRAKELINILN